MRKNRKVIDPYFPVCLLYEVLKAKVLIFGLSLSLVLGMAIYPIQAEASWIDRDGSGIYDGDVDARVEEEDGEAEEAEHDDGTNWFLELLEEGVSFLITLIGRLLFSLLNLMGASLDRLIYGRLVSNPPLFTFDLGEGNVWGIVASAMYQILRGIMILGCILVFIGRIAVASWRRGNIARSAVIEAFSGIFFGILLLLLMPNFLDVALYVRDCVLYLIGTDGAAFLFGSSGGKLGILSVLAESANDNIVSAIMYDAAVFLNLFFLLGYIGVALSMCINFILFPLVVIRMHFDKQILQSWVWEEVSGLLVPVMDAILIMIPSYIGEYGGSLGLLDSVALAGVQVFTCYCILPARSEMRRILGLRTNPLEGTGLGAGLFLGMNAIRGAKNMLDDYSGSKKNAQIDEQSAQMEEDLAVLSQEMETGGTMKSADSLMDYDREDDLDHKGKETDEMDDESGQPLGREQTYASGMESKLDAEEENLDAAFKAQDGQRRLNEIDGELEKARDELQLLEDQNDELSADPDKASLYQDSLNRQHELKEKISSLEEEQEGLRAERTPFDDDILEKRAAALKRRRELEEEYERVANDSISDPDAQNQALHAISEKLDAVDREIAGLDEQNRQEQLKQQRQTLLMEPEMLRREQAELKSNRNRLMQEKEDLLRQHARMQTEQGKYAASDPEYQELASNLSALHKEIAQKDTAIGENAARQGQIQKALRQQENALKDRQAYNLHERVKAQSAYDSARQALESLEKMDSQKGLSEGARSDVKNKIARQKEIMEETKGRLSDLSWEDRRIAAKLREISPDLNLQSPEELRREKRKQQVRKARIQKEIADTEEKISSDPYHALSYKQDIARLKSEAADANLKTAQIDQALDAMETKTSTGSYRGKGSGRISDEYDARRRAVMERYANVDNFERPEFSDISHERKAALYRERSMQETRLRRGRLAGQAAGMAGGALMGTWLGSTGVLLGGMTGSMVGAGIGGTMAAQINGSDHAASFADPGSLDIKIASDLQDASVYGQQRTVERIQGRLEEAINSGRFQQLFREQVVEVNEMDSEIRQAFQACKVTRENYAGKRAEVQEALSHSLLKRTKLMEMDLVRHCAGEEYAALSEPVKAKIRNHVLKHREEETMEAIGKITSLMDDWQPEYARYL